jgi:hypothetical protein
MASPGTSLKHLGNGLHVAEILTSLTTTNQRTGGRPVPGIKHWSNEASQELAYYRHSLF